MILQKLNSHIILSGLICLLTFTTASAKTVSDGELKLGIFRGESSFELKEGKDKDESTLRLRAYSVGYQQLVVKGLGFSTDFTYSNLLQGINTTTNLMLEGNSTYGLNQKLHVFAGVNISQNTSEERAHERLLNKVGIGFGAQVGVGYKILNFLALDLRYIATRHEEDDIKVETSNIRFGIIGLI